MKKRGLSSIVTEVLIILLIIAAVAVIAAFVVPFVKNSLSESSECNDYQDYFMLDESLGFNCQSASSNNIYVTIKAKNSEKPEIRDEIESIEIVFSKKDGASVKANAKNGASPKTEAGGIWLAENNQELLKMPLAGETITYAFNASNEKYETIDVYTKLKSGKICPYKDSAVIFACSGGF